MPNIIVIIHTPQELNHSSYIQTGLFELANKNLINVKVDFSMAKNRGELSIVNRKIVLKENRAFPKASFYTLIDSDSDKTINFTTDLYDSSSHFSKTGLETCDFYFKRNFESRNVNILENETSRKVFKLGMTFGTQSEHSKDRYKFLCGLFVSNLSMNFKWDRHILSRLAKTYSAQKRHWNLINTSRKLERFESFNDRRDDSILFQTRCFPHENNEDVKQIHLQRYRIIKILRDAFPERFIGGFVPSTIAKEFYKDAITNMATSPEEYLNVVKKAGIVIYTRGLVNSPAWKLAEYLSQGKIIIAEPLSTELPIPLRDGKEILYFRDDVELLEKIKMITNNSDLATDLSRNARAYFEKHVHPVQNVKRILEFMLNKSLS